MAVKYKITKAEYEKLSDEMKGEYTAGDGGYVLDLDGGPDPKAAEKFAAERDKRRAAEKRATDAEAAVTEMEDKFSDTAATLKKADEAKVKAEKERDEAKTTHAGYVKATVLDKEADAIASELSKIAPKVLLPHVIGRLDVDLSDPAAPKLVYKDKEGKAGAKRDDVLKEFRDNKDFGAIITGSQASGGGASRHSNTKGSGNAKPTGLPATNTGNEPATVNLGDRAALSTLQERVNARRVASGQEAL